MNLRQAIDHTIVTFQNKSLLTKRETWQGLNVRDKPDMATHELLGHTLTADLLGRNSLDYYHYQIMPDLPWADDHFAERMCGNPLNPPPSEEWWPHATTNAAFKKDGIFSHTYPERFWPKNAGNHPTGIRYPVGDYNDFVALLKREPYTRQGYFPVWFPEDTGNVTGVRTPCTLGYHVMLTNQTADITYYIRSCDLMRHFRNDIYFTCRFLLETIARASRGHPVWSKAKTGTLRMHIANLHCFRNDYYKLFGRKDAKDNAANNKPH